MTLAVVWRFFYGITLWNFGSLIPCLNIGLQEKWKIVQNPYDFEAIEEASQDPDSYFFHWLNMLGQPIAFNDDDKNWPRTIIIGHPYQIRPYIFGVSYMFNSSKE